MDTVQTLLIVDDNVKNLQVVGSILKEEGYRLAIAKDGETAIKLSQQMAPDLILLDIMMPEMDGFEVCRILKDNPDTKDIPVIFLTAKSETNDIVHAFNLGGVDYLTKPFKKEELLVRVKNHLDLVRSKNIIEKQRNELADLNASKDQLFSIISHDLRSPLAGIKSFLNITSKSKKVPSQEEFEEILELMIQNIDQTYNLLDNLLLWARLQRNVLETATKKLNLFEHTLKMVSLLKDVAREKEIIIENSVPEDLLLDADENMLETIIRNLLSNAIKFTPSGGTIKCSAQTDNEFATICIADNGMGMTEEIKNVIFKKNSYVTTYGTESEKGSGLGLNLCADFVEKHGGKIWVETEVDKGSKFYFTIPVYTNV